MKLYIFKHDVVVCICYGTIAMHDVVVYCWQYEILMCWVLGVFFLNWRILVELSVVWDFPYLATQWRLFRLCEAVEMGPLRLCEAVVEDWFECCTLSPVWSSEEGKDVFTLFRLIASIVLDVQCIDIFTHNSLRNKGDSLAAIVGHIEPSVIGN